MWRGKSQMGVYNETGLLKEWPAEGPEKLWVYAGLDKGHSSPVIVGDKIFISTMIDTIGHIVILDLDGKELAKYPYGREFDASFPGARSTPIIVGDWLYIYSGQGVVYALDALSGKKKWSKELFSDLGGDNIRWGVTESLKVDGDQLFCSPGGTENNIVSLNRFTGELIWTSKGKGDLSAYCTPLIVDLPSRKLLVTCMAENIVAVDTKSGEMLWSFPQVNRWSVHPNTPLYHNGKLFSLTGYGTGAVQLNLSSDGSSVSEVWRKETLENQMGGAVLLDGYIYASGMKNRQWQCVNWETGETMWESKDVGKGVVISADGMLYIYTDKGDLVLVEASAEALKVKGQVAIDYGTAQHWSHPVIHNGVLYQRHGDAIGAFKIK